jgi:hypothetical protein
MRHPHYDTDKRACQYPFWAGPRAKLVWGWREKFPIMVFDISTLLCNNKVQIVMSTLLPTVYLPSRKGYT